MNEYYENRFVPTPENDRDELSQSSGKTEDISNSKKHVIRRKEEGIRKKRTVVCYEAKYLNSFIVNAKTNQAYHYRLGSKDELRLFSVILATGETGQTPAILFYDTPREYEAHMHQKVSPGTIKAWNARQTMFRIKAGLDGSQ